MLTLPMGLHSRMGANSRFCLPKRLTYYKSIQSIPALSTTGGLYQMLCIRKCKLCVRILFDLPASVNSPQFEHHTRGGLALSPRLSNLLAYYRTCSGKIPFTCCLGMGVSKSLKRQSSISEGLSRQRRSPETAQNVHCYLSLGVATGTRTFVMSSP